MGYFAHNKTGMMRVLIIEDELSAARRLTQLLQDILPDADILGTIDNVDDAINRLTGNVLPDLVFMDIQLSDGTAFDILEKVNGGVPIIFTTAYDHYAVKAFKFDSIDYLLKPLKVDELKQAVSKYRQYHSLV